MKMQITLSFIATLFTSASFAAEINALTPYDLIQATSVAMDSFKEKNPDHVEHMSGFKTWKSGADAKVKFYVAHDGMNMEYNFVCAKHGDMIHCLAN